MATVSERIRVGERWADREHLESTVRPKKVVFFGRTGEVGVGAVWLLLPRGELSRTFEKIGLHCARQSS